MVSSDRGDDFGLESDFMTPCIKRWLFCVAGLLVASDLICGKAAGGNLWYNGDLDQRDSLVNQTGLVDGLVSDNFVVPVGKTYTITGVFSNDAMYVDPTGLKLTAHWEIRSGVSAGGGGILLASGDGPDSASFTGQTFSHGDTGVPVFTNQVNGLSVTLGPGMYWLAVAPDLSEGNSFIVTTSGSGAIGSPPGNDGNSFISSTYFGLTFVPTSAPPIEGSRTRDYSMGLIGTSATICEPSSLILGLIGSAGYGCTRRAPTLEFPRRWI